MKIWDSIYSKLIKKTKQEVLETDSQLHQKSYEEVQRERAIGIMKWLDGVSEKYFEKNNLVCFIQFGYNRSIDERYFMCGYLNSEGSKFRDISTGDVYDVFDAPYPNNNVPEGESMRSTISINDRPFVRVEARVFGKKKSNAKLLELDMDNTALASKTFCDDRVLVVCDFDYRKDSVALYDLFDTEANNGVISGRDVIRAINEGNNLCTFMVNMKMGEKIREAHLAANEKLKKDIKDSASPTLEELDF